jgi:oxygen-independent coproporphyrinogen-3 oxidase
MASSADHRRASTPSLGGPRDLRAVSPGGPACASGEPLEGNYFVSTYPPFSTWSSEDVPEVDRVLATPPAAFGVPLGLYVHIPFCVKRCDYCYYLSYTDKSAEQIDVYADALLRELKAYRERPLLADREPAFVYFGGGTPSLLSGSSIARLLAGLQRVFPWTSAQEVTFECAPQTVTPAKMRTLNDAGVTRVSLGIQQFNDVVLKTNGRVHLVRDIEQAWPAIREVGFDVVNVDLMVGMLGETDETFFDSLERVIALAPDSVTIYLLEIPLNTPLYCALSAGALLEPPPGWEVKRARLKRAFARFEQCGYAVRSAYAAVRDPQRHRFVYQDEQYHGADLLGIGAASFSYLNGVHYQNAASFDGYMAAVREGDLPISRAHALSDEERLVREFVLQLKLGAVDAGKFQSRFGVDVLRRFEEPLRSFADEGWLAVEGGSINLTRDGLVRVDRMLPSFYLPEHQGLRYT